MANTNSNFEDTIQCSVFSVSHTTDKLSDLCKELNTFIDTLSKDYVWHRDEFKLCVTLLDNDSIGMPVHITSTTCFGDNIEDEWFIVYLVFQITNRYKNIIVHMTDNDGNFLLIEAADYLPSWANPDTTENRVFIYQGQIHLIPPNVIDLDIKIGQQDAMELVIKNPIDTIAAKEIQEAVLNRISCYPQKIKDSQHRALVTLPEEIAALLTMKPSLISPIVTSYCNHDAMDAKCLKNIKFENCVTVPIIFTKYLYAMLMHSKLPRINKFTNSSTNNKEAIIGWKIAGGYEIIMNKLSNDIFSSSAYSKFINSLTKNGYFKDNIEGSKQYNVLLEKAKDFFANIECPLSLYYSNYIANLKNTEDFTKQKKLLKLKENCDKTEIDTDEWLNINPDELNTFLYTNYGKKIVKSGDAITPQIKTELANFLQQTSDFEGIEYDKEEQSDQHQIEFDADQFADCVQKMLKLVTGETCEEDGFDSDVSEDIDMLTEEDLDKELASKLQSSEIGSGKDENIMKNLLQSLKEEGTSGPSSTILKNLVLSKTEFSDSDDDVS